VDGADKLRDGIKVKLINRDPAASVNAASPPSGKERHQGKGSKNGNNE
jgi:hypothetical protein